MTQTEHVPVTEAHVSLGLGRASVAEWAGWVSRHWVTMADIFISYSKSDRALALKLSTFLESEGWSVWWDTSLGAADLYRDEIMKQLAAARAVITIWSPNSIKSDWVRAEAGRAKADGKLIPVKTADLTYPDIPLPFGEMYTENLASTDLIRAAIVTQLAKPIVAASQLWKITNTFKYQILTWIGIAGSAITLFANLNGVINLADWAKELVDHWHEWTQLFWGWVFSLVKMRVPREFVPIISFVVFVGILIAGLNFSARTVTSAVNLQQSRSLARKLSTLLGGSLLYLITIATITLLTLRWSSSRVDYYTLLEFLIAFFGVPIGYLLYFGNERLLIGVSSLLFTMIFVCLLYIPWIAIPRYDGDPSKPISLGVIILLFPIGWMVVILFSPLQQLTRRLSFVVLGVLALVVLSEISKLNLHQYLQPTRVGTFSGEGLIQSPTAVMVRSSLMVNGFGELQHALGQTKPLLDISTAKRSRPIT